MTKLESWTEDKARKYITGLGGEYIKFTPLNYVGFPDRIILGPNRIVLFVEFKQVGKDPRKKQGHVHHTLRRLGFEVFVIDEWKTIVNIFKARLKQNEEV